MSYEKLHPLVIPKTMRDAEARPSPSSPPSHTASSQFCQYSLERASEEWGAQRWVLRLGYKVYTRRQFFVITAPFWCLAVLL